MREMALSYSESKTPGESQNTYCTCNESKNMLKDLLGLFTCFGVKERFACRCNYLRLLLVCHVEVRHLLTFLEVATQVSFISD